MGQRRDRLDKRLAVAKVTRQKNSLKKASEQSRREKQMLALIKAGKAPYTPGVMSWLSERLDKKSCQITEADIQALLKQ